MYQNPTEDIIINYDIVNMRQSDRVKTDTMCAINVENKNNLIDVYKFRNFC